MKKQNPLLDLIMIKTFNKLLSIIKKLIKTKKSVLFFKKSLLKLIIYIINLRDKYYYKSYNFSSILEIISTFDINKTNEYLNGMFFSKDIPNYIKRHRKYYSIKNRGFGENSFHVMWFLLFKEFRPENILEIGVYRGQILTLWSLLSRDLGINSKIFGLSPLSNIGDSTSDYKELNYEKDIQKHCDFFNIKKPTLIKEFSNSKKGIEFIKSKKWELIYIDGNHDYEIVKEDFLNSYNSLKDNGFIILDDSSVYLKYKAKIGSSSGHEGPSKVLIEYGQTKMLHIGTVGHNNILQKII